MRHHAPSSNARFDLLALHSLCCCCLISEDCEWHAANSSGYVKSVIQYKTRSLSLLKAFFVCSFLHKQLNLAPILIGKSVLITYFIFGASIWAASEQTTLQLQRSCLSATCLQINSLYLRFLKRRRTELRKSQ